MTGNHPRNIGPMLSSPRCGARTRSGKPCRSPAVAGKNALPHAWRSAGVWRSARQQKRIQAWALYPRSHCGTPAVERAHAAIAGANRKDQVKVDFAFAVRLDGTFVTIGMSPIISFLFGIPETGVATLMS
jgi:hypothetical protein